MKFVAIFTYRIFLINLNERIFFNWHLYHFPLKLAGISDQPEFKVNAFLTEPIVQLADISYLPECRISTFFS